MKLDSDKIVKKAFFIAVVAALFFAAVIQASSEAEKVKYTDLEKEQIDSSGDGVLKEYYGELLGYVKENAKFNNIATKDDIAIFNVTIDGKDKRILTRLKTAALFPAQTSLTDTIRTTNLVVLGNISLKGVLFSEVEDTFGPRKLYGIESTSLRYVDEGFARLVNGKANVSINPVLRELISSYNVFLSAEGLTKGIYVAEKTNSYFVVKSVNANSNVGFSWMLRGVRKDYDYYLNSEYGKSEGIEIKAEINFENGTAEIKINGLNKIFGLINASKNNYSIINETNINQTSNQSLILITGNLVDEFGLETDLGKILGEATPLPNLSKTAPSASENITPAAGGNATSNETAAGLNEIASLPVSSVLEFTLYSTNEEFIMSQVADVTGLSLGQVKKLINFVYKEPENFEDETIEEAMPKLDFIEKVNGSVIIRLG